MGIEAISAGMKAHWADPEVREARRRAARLRDLERWAVRMRASGMGTHEVHLVLERNWPIEWGPIPRKEH